MSSASIPAISFVFKVVSPARGHQSNEMNPSIPPGSIGIPGVAVKSGIKGKHHRSPRLIANHSQLEERTPQILLIGIV
jgi:hypothetical protein